MAAMKNSDFSFYASRGYRLSLCITTSVFFYFFIVYFLPFGVDNYNPDHQYTLAFFREIFYFFAGLLGVLLLNEFVLRPYILKGSSSRHIILWSIWTLFLSSSSIFYIYNFLGNWHDYTLSSYFEFLVNVSIVLLFPMVGTFFFFRYRSLQRRIEHILTTKEDYVDSKELITFKGKGSKDQIVLSSDSFLYGRAQDNYVELYYLEQDQLKKFLIRSTLRSLVQSVDATTISRCHRSYIVNLLHIKALKGGNQDITVYLHPLDTQIPVSRSYKEAVLTKLHGLKNFS